VANPTTNYGFVLPTATDLVTDLPADFDVALQGVDTQLKALNPETTLGDIAYRSATANTNTRLGIGATGEVLTVVGGVPAWAAGGGKVLQIVTGTYSTSTTIASTSFTDSGLSLSITPTKNTSTILIMISQPISISRNFGQAAAAVQIVRNSTNIFTSDQECYYVYDDTSVVNIYGTIASFHFVDSPATTSATTYKTQWRVPTTANSAKVITSVVNQVASITLMEIGA